MYVLGIRGWGCLCTGCVLHEWRPEPPDMESGLRFRNAQFTVLRPVNKIGYLASDALKYRVIIPPVAGAIENQRPQAHVL